MTVDVQNVSARAADHLKPGAKWDMMFPHPVTGRYTVRRPCTIVSVKNRGGGEYTLALEMPQ